MRAVFRSSLRIRLLLLVLLAILPAIGLTIYTYTEQRRRATALVRSYKRDLDRNRSALRAVQRELASRKHALTEVRILDVLIWSAFAN